MNKIETTEWKALPHPILEHVIAVGDIHGCLSQMVYLEDWIAANAVPALYIRLGDYIDRGPDSRGVINRIMNDPMEDHTKVMNLWANHEEMLYYALHSMGNNFLQHFLGNGGVETVASYVSSDKNWNDFVVEFTKLGHYEIFNKMIVNHRIGKYVFVHAGIDPYYDRSMKFDEYLQSYDPKQLHAKHEINNSFLWIRDEFLTHMTDYPENTIVVHGHTPCRPDFYHDNKFAIDSGCVFHGVLTAIEMKDTQYRLIYSYGEHPRFPGEWGRLR